MYRWKAELNKLVDIRLFFSVEDELDMFCILFTALCHTKLVNTRRFVEVPINETLKCYCIMAACFLADK